MIYLEHLNLVVSDIPRTLKFYKAAFPHWRIRAEGAGTWYEKPRKWIHFGDDYQYLAFGDNGIGNNRDLSGHDSGLGHFAFVCGNLNTLIERLGDAGFSIAKPGAEDPWSKNVYFMDPDKNEVEFIEYLSDLPEERNFSKL